MLLWCQTSMSAALGKDASRQRATTSSTITTTTTIYKGIVA